MMIIVQREGGEERLADDLHLFLMADALMS